MDDAAHLAAITASPDDDAPRLVYADVLQARGDPRGELIATQIAHDRAVAAGDADAAERLADAVADLLIDHAAALTPPVLHGPYGPAELVRGFATRISTHVAYFEAVADDLASLTPHVEVHLEAWHHLDLARAARLAAHPALARVRSMTLRGSFGEASAALLASPHLTELRTLEIAEVTAEIEAQLVRADALPHLERLDADPSPVVTRRLLSSTALPSLRHLSLALRDDADVRALIAPHRRERWTELRLQHGSDDAIAALLAAGLPALRRLIYEGVDERPAPGCWRALAAAELPALRTLDIGDLHLDTSDLAVLLSWPQLARLDELSLERTDLPDGVDAVLAGVALPALRRLSMSVAAIGPDSARALGRGGFAGLEWLSLEQTRLGDAGIAALADAPALGRLRELRLVDTGQSSVGTRALIEARGLPALRSLTLYGRPLDDAAVAALAAGRALPRLRRITLGGLGFRPEWFTTLFGAPVIARLAELRCVGAPVTDEALLALAANPDAAALRLLDLHRAVGPTEVGLRALASSPHLTRLRVEHAR